MQTLQEVKDSPDDFDWTLKDYAVLLDFDLNRFKVDESLPEESRMAPVEMSREEIRMQTIVEVLI